MGKRRLLKFVIILILGVFVSSQVSLSPGEGTMGEDEIRENLRFESGQKFTYDLKMETEDEIFTGEVTLWVSDAEDNLMEIIIEGMFDEVSFNTSATGLKDDPEDLFIKLATALYLDLPPNVSDMLLYTFLAPWIYTPLDEDGLYVGREGYEVDEYGDTLFISIPEMRIFAGIEGYLVQVGYEGEKASEICINPELPLPLMVSGEGFTEEDYEVFAYRVELAAYQEDAVAPEFEASARVLAEEVLIEVVEHFRESGFEIGETNPKAYRMMDAVAGFGVDIGGGDVELYLFDPASAETETMENLEAARSTGIFWFSALEMEIPVAINENILLTGLELGTFYKHPLKDEIIEAFKLFQLE